MGRLCAVNATDRAFVACDGKADLLPAHHRVFHFAPEISSAPNHIV